VKRLVILLFVLLSVGIGSGYADKTDKNDLNFRKTNREHKTYLSAVGISANSSGDIAIGFVDDYINVYDKYGNFKYSFAFNVEGRYLFEFDEQDDIMIFSVRDSAYYYFNSDAELIKTEKISNSEESESYYTNHSSKRKVNNVDIDGINYSLKQVFGYIRLIKTDADGNETIIYETGLQYIVKVLIVLVILAFAAIVICGLIKTISTEMKKYM